MIATQTGVELVSMEFHQESKTYRAGFDQEQTSPSMAVVSALSELLDTDPLELAPLHDAIDTEALDALVRIRDRTRGDISITFSVSTYEITVYSYGMVAIESAESEVTDGRIEESLEQ